MEQNTQSPDNNLESFTIFFNQHRGQFVLMDRVVYRFIALATDEWDYYWVLYDGKKLRWVTCLMTLVPLKDEMSEYYYNKLVHISKLNDFDQIEYWGHKNLEEAKKFREEHIKEITFMEGKDNRYMTDLEWNIF